MLTNLAIYEIKYSYKKCVYTSMTREYLVHGFKGFKFTNT